MTKEKALDIVEKTINKLGSKITLLESENKKLILENKRLETICNTRCCKSDSELLSNFKNKLSFKQWKEVNNYRLTGNDLIKKGNLTFTAPEVFKQYKEYVSEIA